jgi:hypothetical protein
VRDIFVTQIKEWFGEVILKDRPKLSEFSTALREGRAEDVERLFTSYLIKTISIRDTFARNKENFYHGILLGLLAHEEEWLIMSNAEAGDGYSDIIIELEEERIGIVIEVKYAENNTLEASCEKAMEQMKQRQYSQRLYDDGIENILMYGIACYKKRCKVMLEREKII